MSKQSFPNIKFSVGYILSRNLEIDISAFTFRNIILLRISLYLLRPGEQNTYALRGLDGHGHVINLF